jgi:glutathione S-transferase
MARIVVIEKGLQNRVEIISAKTRVADSPYYEINPSGRVPYLICDDGIRFEESHLICAYLDQLDGKPVFQLARDVQSWDGQRLEALARSLVDGLSVWGREMSRPENERSPGIIRHETKRAERMTRLWEREIEHRLMHGPLNMAQITLACGLGMEARNPDFRWRSANPKLSEWFGRIAARQSFTATAPPGA